MLHVFSNVFMVMNMSAMCHVVSIVVSQVFGYVLVMMNMTAFCMVATMLFHVLSHVLMVVFNVTAVLHAMNMAMLFRMVVLNMVQLGFTVVLSTTAMERMLMVGNMIVMFHDRSLINRLFRHVSYPKA
jgi:hypothetical protein